MSCATPQSENRPVPLRVTPVLIVARPTVLADVRVLRALVHVLHARHVPVAGGTRALEAVRCRVTRPAVAARPGSAVVVIFTVSACKWRGVGVGNEGGEIVRFTKTNLLPFYPNNYVPASILRFNILAKA